MRLKFNSGKLFEGILLAIILWNLPTIPAWKWILYLFTIITISFEWDLLSKR